MRPPHSAQQTLWSSSPNGPQREMAREAQRLRLIGRWWQEAASVAAVAQSPAACCHHEHLLGVHGAHQGERHVAAAAQSYTRSVQVSMGRGTRRNHWSYFHVWTGRIIWSTVLVQLLLLSIYLTLLLWLKFYSYPILNTISNDLSITEVAFPGVTICSPKAVNTERVARYVQTLWVTNLIDAGSRSLSPPAL